MHYAGLVENNFTSINATVKYVDFHQILSLAFLYVTNHEIVFSSKKTNVIF